MSRILALTIDASSRTFGRMGRERFTSLLCGALASAPGLEEAERGLAAASAAQRAWVAWYLGGAWASVVVAVESTPPGGGSPTTGPRHRWHVILVPEGCSLDERRVALRHAARGSGRSPEPAPRTLSGRGDPCPA